MLQKHYSRKSEGFSETATARFPYTYARVSAMKAELIGKADYSKLLKMSLSEVISFLESTQYKKEIDELAVSSSGIKLVELALNRNLSSTYRKLRRISGPRLRKLLDIYLRRKDIANIKTIIRAKYTGTDESEISGLLYPSELSREFLKSLLKKQTIEEMLKEIRMVRPAALRSGLEKLKETNSLAEIENALDQNYINEMLKLASMLPRGSLFKKFLLAEIGIMNIINIFRFKREGMERKEISRLMFKAGSSIAEKLADAQPEELASAFEKTIYGQHAKKGIEEFRKKGTLIFLEIELYSMLLKKALLLLKQRPLVADAIIGYLFAKEIEVRNLRMLIKAKQLGMAGEFMEEQLIA